MDYKMLGHLSLPEDIKKLTDDELRLLAAEIRDYLIRSVARTGGHLASNLGVVETTIAMHRVFDCPRDQFIFDVGHQSYVHKILTGRMDRFDTLRQKDGLSGFPDPEEGPYDPFRMGHSSTSVSLGLGLSVANQIRGNDANVVVLIGDGAMTGGMVYEALSNIKKSNEKLIILLNDNKMSISKNVGFVSRYLSKIRAKPRYFKLKDSTKGFLKKLPLIGPAISRGISKIKMYFKMLIYRENVFETFGLTYLGPVDGHDIRAMTDILRRAKELEEPVIVHVRTKKGKGYSFAEHSPEVFHGVSSFDVNTGESISNPSDSFSSSFGELLCHKVAQNQNLYVITAAMCEGCGLDGVASQYPKRLFDVGIAEGHAVTFAAGLSKNGILPVFCVYSSFLQRGFDQIIHDIALQKAHVIFAVDRCGIVGADGETHQGLFDVPFMLTVPNLTVFSPATYKEMNLQFDALCEDPERAGVIRYPRGKEVSVSLPFKESAENFEVLCGDAGLLVISYGVEIQEVVFAIDHLENKPTVMKVNRIHPIGDALVKFASMYPDIIIYEEGYKYGGVGSMLCQKLTEIGYKGSISIHGIPPVFVKQATVAETLAEYGLDRETIFGDLKRYFEARKDEKQ